MATKASGTGQQVNGTAPADDDGTAPADDDGQAPGAGAGPAPVETSPVERVMGGLAIAAAVGLFLIGLDMVTGGAVLPALAALVGPRDGGG